MKRSGLERLRIHDLRHNAASWMVMGGVGLPITGRVFGHASPGTSSRYAHVGEEPAGLAQEACALKIKAAGEGKLMNIVDELKKEITPTKGKGQKNGKRRKGRKGSSGKTKSKPTQGVS